MAARPGLARRSEADPIGGSTTVLTDPDTGSPMPVSLRLPPRNPNPAKLLRREPRDADVPGNWGPVHREIPEELWTPETEEQIKLFIDKELQIAEGERQPFIWKLARWKYAYRAPLDETPKNFPIANASNLTIPVIKETVNTIVSGLVQSNLTVRPRFMFETIAAEWEPFVDELETFMDIASERDLKLRKTMTTAITELAKLGTTIVETGHMVDERKLYQYTADGKRVFPRTVVHHDGPITFPIPLEDFWIRFHETDIQRARWCAKRLLLSEQELRDREAVGKFFNVDWLINPHEHLEKGDDVIDQVNENIEKTISFSRDGQYEIFEIYLSWDIDGDTRFEELRLYYSRDARMFIGKQFNPYRHGKRPFVRAVYNEIEHRFYGEGLCEMLEALQHEISTQHNQRIDNATLANLKMIIKRKIMKGLKPGDRLYSGKIIEANDIWNDIREFTLSEIYPSTTVNEQISRGYADRLSGINEPRSMPVTRTTATAQAMLLQEQAKRFDLVNSNIREAINEIGEMSISLYFQYGVNGKALAWMGERGRTIEAIFRLPKRVIEIGLAIRARTPTSQLNREQRQQNAIGMFQLTTQMYERILPLVSQMAPDQMGEVVYGLVRSARHFMSDVLEAFDSPNPEEILSGLTTIERLLAPPEDMGGLESQRRAEESATLLAKIGRLEDLLREAEATRGGSNGVRAFRTEPRRGLGAPDVFGRSPTGNGTRRFPTNR